MKLNAHYILHRTGDKTIIVPTAAAAFSGIVEGNRTLGDIVELLQSDTTQEASLPPCWQPTTRRKVLSSGTCGRYSTD